jgi:tRNA wybutosine-synthesizing protein 3
MGKDSSLGKKRFTMVKQRHLETFDEALERNRADKRMVPLCRFVASTKNFFTSSGCAGRILLIQLPKGESKREASFHRKWHREISFEETKKAMQEETRGELWMKVEPFILHIGSDSIGNARKILAVMSKAGVKRGGMIVAKEGKFLVELQGTQEMSVPLKHNEKILVQDDYLQWLVGKANSKLGKNYQMLERFERECRRSLK